MHGPSPSHKIVEWKKAFRCSQPLGLIQGWTKWHVPALSYKAHNLLQNCFRWSWNNGESGKFWWSHFHPSPASRISMKRYPPTILYLQDSRLSVADSKLYPCQKLSQVAIHPRSYSRQREWTFTQASRSLSAHWARYAQVTMYISLEP